MFDKKRIIVMLVMVLIFLSDSIARAESKLEDQLLVYRDACNSLSESLLEIERQGNGKNPKYQEAIKAWKEAKQSLEETKKSIEDEIKSNPTESLPVLEKFFDTRAGRSPVLRFSGFIDLNKKLLEKADAKTSKRTAPKPEAPGKPIWRLPDRKTVSDSSGEAREPAPQAPRAANDWSWLKPLSPSTNELYFLPQGRSSARSSGSRGTGGSAPVPYQGQSAEQQREFEDFKSGRIHSMILSPEQFDEVQKMGREGTMYPGEYIFKPIYK